MSIWYSKVKTIDRFDPPTLHKRSIELTGEADNIYMAAFLMGDFFDRRGRDVQEELDDCGFETVKDWFDNYFIMLNGSPISAYASQEEWNGGISTSKEMCSVAFDESEESEDAEHEW